MSSNIYDGIDREKLGRRVREKWIEWAKEQPNPKPSWLVPWEEMGEYDREVDRRIGETIDRETISWEHYARFYCGEPAVGYTIDGAESQLVCSQLACQMRLDRAKEQYDRERLARQRDVEIAEKKP